MITKREVRLLAVAIALGAGVWLPHGGSFGQLGIDLFGVAAAVFYAWSGFGQDEEPKNG